MRRTVGVLHKVAQKVITYDDVKYMFDNPSPESWNPKISTAPSHGLYLYDMGYDEADLVVPIESIKSEQPAYGANQSEDSLDLRKEIIKERIKQRKAALNSRITSSLEKIEQHEFLRSDKK